MALRPAEAGDAPAPAVRRPLYSQPSILLTLVVGGAVGTTVRGWLESMFPAPTGTWPWTTFWINVTGSFVLGALLAGLARSGPDLGWRRRVRIGVGTGVIGGYTTYSTFIVEVDTLLRSGHLGTGTGYALASIVCGVAAAAAALLLGRALPHRGAPR